MADSQLCAVVTGRTMAEMRAGRDAVRGADLVELRLDFADRPDAAGALQGRRLPVVVTCRARWEGGRFDGSEDERRRILESALDLGAEYVDVEAAAGFARALVEKTGGRRIVISEHKFDLPPGDVRGRFAALRSSGAEIAKLAVQVESLEQLSAIFDIADEAGPDRDRILIAMGAAGLPSRVLSARLGSRWTYAGDDVAPGQVSAARLLRDFRFHRIAADAALYGVAGNPIVHSRSPIMHNAGFAALGLKAVYVPLQARDAGDFAGFARRSRLAGASITTPFKVALMKHMDHVEPLARRVGAINTLVIRDGRWIGGNTDVDGFLAPLEKRMRLPGARAVVLGSGGAARAVMVALLDRGARVTLCARRADAARAIVDEVGGSVGAWPPPASSWDLLVNATTVGSAANPGDPMDGMPLDGGTVYDLVYAPAETPGGARADTVLAERARRAGCQTIGGIEMLIAQAERQFELWTGQRPPAGLFEDVSTREADYV
jgi:3-dehydroquinate dehydratase/shikimate dehydrogenase